MCLYELLMALPPAPLLVFNKKERLLAVYERIIDVPQFLLPLFVEYAYETPDGFAITLDF